MRLFMEEKKQIGTLFNRIAGSYDRLNHLLSFNFDRRWRRKAVKGMTPADSVLDVAIGTADLAIELVKKERARHVLGIDLSEEMMHIGQQKVEDRKLSHQICFQLSDAQQMPFDDNTFDAVTCAYGVRNFSDLQRGLEEMLRVLRPGGQLMILEFSYPENKLIAWSYDLYFSHVMPHIGRWISRDRSAYAYLNKSVKRFVWGEDMVAVLRRTGFDSVTYHPLTCGITTIYRATKQGR